MDGRRFFYRLYRVDHAGVPLNFLGMAFPIAPNGGLFTCRHVVDIRLDDGEYVAIYDSESGTMHRQATPQFPNDDRLDLAYLPDAFGRQKPEYFPILDPDAVSVGEEVYTYGAFVPTISSEPVEGYFKGNIVNALGRPERTHLELTLSF